MKRITARASEVVLEGFAGSNLLLAFDYDGTLAPIVNDPSRAVMRPSTRALLRRLCRVYPCVVISGRRTRDLVPFLKGIDILTVVGYHGVERGEANRVQEWKAVLELRLAGLRGVIIEDKESSLTVHYRRSPDKGLVKMRVRRAAGSLDSVRLVEGEQTLNLLPSGRGNKGTALAKLIRAFDCSAAVYVGDEDTDEDAFALQTVPLLAVRVGRKPGSNAAYYLKDQREIDALLSAFLSLRRTRTRRRA